MPRVLKVLPPPPVSTEERKAKASRRRPSRRSREIEASSPASPVLSPSLLHDYTRGPADEPKIVLSFDGGSSDRGAEEIIDTLRRYGITTTIFLTGQFIRNYPKIVAQIVADGHEVGNHTWSHPHLTSYAENGRHSTRRSVRRASLQSELARTAAEYRRVTGQEMSKLWRAPFGEHNREIRSWAAELGYRHIGWTRGSRYSLDSLDWVVDRRSRNYYTPAQLTTRLVDFDAANRTTLNGGIILMHLGSDRREAERLDHALPQIIERLRDRGFSFVKVSELEKEPQNAG